MGMGWRRYSSMEYGPIINYWSDGVRVITLEKAPLAAYYIVYYNAHIKGRFTSLQKAKRFVEVLKEYIALGGKL